MFSDYLLTAQNKETALLKSVIKLHQICKQYNMKSFVKAKVIAFRGKESIRTKIIINDRIVEQMSCFNFLGGWL